MSGKRLWIAFAVVLVLSLLVASQALAGHMKYNHYKGHRYLLVLGTGTWEEADAWARAQTYKGLKGHLVTITSEGENAFVNNYIGGYAGWIGGKQSGEPGSASAGWSWAGTGEPWTYANWNSGEPNDGDGTENSAENFLFMEDGLWNDAPGTLTMDWYIVEFDKIIP